MKILVVGNLGYLGPVLSKYFKDRYENIYLTGYDIGYFKDVRSYIKNSGDELYDKQIIKDVRNVELNDLKNFDVVVYLAAISNDPMGNEFEKPTMEINYKSAIRFAKFAKKKGVKKFVFASSCSVYGTADEYDRNEESDVMPLTAYAKSKVFAERDLKFLADSNFEITCLRFATACGWSDRLRLDLVFNDFICGAYINKEIQILSDGTSWRPLIHVNDMSRAIDWACSRNSDNAGDFCIVNVGSNNWNLMIKNLAYIVAEIIPNVNVSINPKGQPDKRSYRVDFSKFMTLAPNYQPLETPQKNVLEFYEGLEKINFSIKNYRDSEYIRLNVLRRLLANGVINQNLVFNDI